MDVNDLKSLYAEVSKRMGVALEHVRHELAGVRTGRASVTILDPVHVEAYGSRMALNQPARLSGPGPAMIIAQPCDPAQHGAVRDDPVPGGTQPEDGVGGGDAEIAGQRELEAAPDGVAVQHGQRALRHVLQAVQAAGPGAIELLTAGAAGERGSRQDP